MYFTYALLDPLTNCARYIGSTRWPDKRYESHKTDKSDSPKVRWMQQWQSRGKIPALLILSKHRTCVLAREFERHFIREFERDGFHLLNQQSNPQWHEKLRLHRAKLPKFVTFR